MTQYRFTSLFSFIAGCLLYSHSSHAEDVSFSIGTGVPFLVVPEISLSSEDGSTRYYFNLKGSASSGAAIGFETLTSDSPNHAFGGFVGSIGIREGEDACPTEIEDPVDVIAQPIACALIQLFDWETVNGVGVSYSYNWNGLNQSGWRVRFELGYGQGTQSDNNYGSGAVLLSYQF